MCFRDRLLVRKCLKMQFIISLLLNYFIFRHNAASSLKLGAF